MVVKMYVLTSLIICLLSVNDFFSTSLLLRDPESLVLIVCKHQKSNIFWNSAFARKSAINPLCRFQNSNISCPSKRHPSLMGVSAERLWRWAGRRRNCGTSHDPCQQSVVTVSARVFFTWSLVPAAQSVKNERYTNMSGFQDKPQKKTKKTLRNC